MKAKELAAKLMENPDREVVIKDDRGEYPWPVEYVSSRYVDSDTIEWVYEDEKRPDAKEVTVIHV